MHTNINTHNYGAPLLLVLVLLGVGLVLGWFCHIDLATLLSKTMVTSWETEQRSAAVPSQLKRVHLRAAPSFTTNKRGPLIVFIDTRTYTELHNKHEPPMRSGLNPD